MDGGYEELNFTSIRKEVNVTILYKPQYKGGLLSRVYGMISTSRGESERACTIMYVR